jgi:hypothetical protein
MLADIIALLRSLAEIEPRTGRKAPSVVTTADRVGARSSCNCKGGDSGDWPRKGGEEFAPKFCTWLRRRPGS